MTIFIAVGGKIDVKWALRGLKHRACGWLFNSLFKIIPTLHIAGPLWESTDDLWIYTMLTQWGCDLQMCICSVLSHYLIRCWPIVHWTFLYQFQRNLNQYTTIFMQGEPTTAKISSAEWLPNRLSHNMLRNGVTSHILRLKVSNLAVIWWTLPASSPPILLGTEVTKCVISEEISSDILKTASGLRNAVPNR